MYSVPLVWISPCVFQNMQNIPLDKTFSYVYLEQQYYCMLSLMWTLQFGGFIVLVEQKWLCKRTKFMFIIKYFSTKHTVRHWHFMNVSNPDLSFFTSLLLASSLLDCLCWHIIKCCDMLPLTTVSRIVTALSVEGGSIQVQMSIMIHPFN